MVGGDAVYPRRKDLYYKNFWQCPECKGFVGTHKRGLSKKPLGCIPDAQMKKARMHIHKILDPIWKSGRTDRSELYEELSEFIGEEYHTAELRSVELARDVYAYIRNKYY